MRDANSYSAVIARGPRSTQPTPHTGSLSWIPVDSVTLDVADASCLAVGDTASIIDGAVKKVRIIQLSPWLATYTTNA